MRRLRVGCAIAAIAFASTADAQPIQTNSFTNDVVVGANWQDLTIANGTMANATIWVANRSPGSILVVFSASGTPPTGGGTIVPPNSPPLYGSAAHVWVKSVGGGSLIISTGLGAVAGGSGGISATASAAAPAYAAGSQALSMDLNGQLRTKSENGAIVALGSTSDSAWNGSGPATLISVAKTIASAALDTTSVTTMAIDSGNPGVTNVATPSCRIITGTPAYATASLQALACNAAGQLKVAAQGLTSATSTSTNISASLASTQLLAANASRTGGSIVNDSAAVMYLKLSSGASSTSYDYLLSGSVNGIPAQFEIPDGWTGPVYAAWASASGAARISERTP